VAITGLLSLLFSKRYYRLLGGLVCGFSIWCIVGENQRLEQRALRLERLQSAHEKAMMQNPGNQETNAPRSQETNVFYQLTGQFFPTRKVEALHSPIGITGWSESGLRLADGRTVQLPGFRKLPPASPALTEATKRGVEIAADGRVYGLVRVHHWCGNDPVREHIARVDVADMLMFVREGEWVTMPSLESLMLICRTQGGTFSQRGWIIDEFMGFEGWRR